MDVTLLVRVVQRIKGLGNDRDRILIGKTSTILLSQFGGVSSINKLRDQIDHAVMSTAVDKLDNISMLQRRRHIDLSDESLHGLITDSELRQQCFDSDRMPGALIATEHYTS